MASPENAEVLRLNSELRDAWLADPAYSFDDLRRIFEDWLAMFEIPSGTAFEETEYGGVPCIWATAPGADASRTIVHFHSGGYMLGSAGGYKSFGGFLSQATGNRVLLVDYRLAPDHPYPAGIDDGMAVVQALLDGGVAPGSLILTGDSAGGGLVLVALQRMRDLNLPLPACAVAISPVTNFSFDGPSFTENADVDPLVTADFMDVLAQIYCGEADRKAPGFSPLFGNWQGLPPLLILAGEIEMLRDDGKLAAAAAREQGVDATYFEGPGMAHIWTLFADRLPEGRESLALIADFIKAKVPGRS